MWLAAGKGLLGAVKLWALVTVVIIALSVLMNLLRHIGSFDRLAARMRLVAKGLGISPPAMFPLLVGVGVGITYGGGILLQVAREAIVSARDMFLVIIFLGLCHAIFEDTILFVLLGGNAAIIVGVRLVLAVVVTAILARYVGIGKSEGGPEPAKT